MKITLLLFLLAFCAGKGRGVEVLSVSAGKDLNHFFKIDSERGQKQLYLCRLPCGPGDRLLQVDGLSIKSGRYSLQMNNLIQVVITQVTKQDAGLYRVGVISGGKDRPIDFQLEVTDLCDGVVDRDKKREYWGVLGSDLMVPCDLYIPPTNRKFLCREDCSTFLIDTKDQGNSPKYSLEHVGPGIRATIKNLSPSDAGRYRCGVGHNNTYYTCQEFTVRIKDRAHVAPSVVVFFLVVVVLTLVIILIRTRTETQSAHYVNITSNATTRPGQHCTLPAFSDNVPDYATLRPEMQESEYSEILPPIPSILTQKQAPH